jgi:hypothetical protein
MGDELCYGRPVSYYEKICNAEGFQMKSVKFINIRTSYYVGGAIRKGLNSKTRVEGEPLNKISVLLQRMSLPVTRILDQIFTSKKDIARMEFTRINS